MQKITAWLRPRHYYIESGSVRRFNRRALLHMVSMLPLFALGIVLGAHLFAVKPMVKAQSAQVELADTAQQPSLTTPDPETVKPVSNYIEVAGAVQAWARAHSSAQWGVVVQDMNEPTNIVRYNDTAQFESASLYKLFLTIPLAQKLPFAQWQALHTLNGQGDHTVAECVQAMLAQSDNACGEAAGDYVGWSNAARVARSNGFSNTTLANSPIKTTANDVAKYLTGLEQGKWFDEATRQFLLDSLSAQKYRDGIPTGCDGCTVLNKTGQLNGVTHDAAIVTSGSKRYVLVILSQGGSYAQIAELTKLINGSLL